MFRRAAKRLNDGAAGFSIALLIKTDANANQTGVYLFECSSTGGTTEEPTANITYTDGCPAEVPLI